MRLAIFTLLRNEQVFFPVWLQHYLHHVPAEDIYVLDHESSGDALDSLQALHAEYKFNLLRVRHRWAYHTQWMSGITRAFQTYLLASYKWVLFSAADELVTPRPELNMRLPEFVQAPSVTSTGPFRCNGFEVVHKADEEPALVLTQPWLDQRKWWYHSPRYSKPLLASVPLHWLPGWFGARNVPEYQPPYRDLLLVHLHKIDLRLCVEKHQLTPSQPLYPDFRTGVLAHNLLDDPEKISRWILSNASDSTQWAPLVEIPQGLKEMLQCRSDG